MNIPEYSKKLIDEMNRYYEARAPLHDEYMSYESPEALEELLKPIIDTVKPIIRRKDVLEIACGTGNWTQVLANGADSVAAIDASPSALEIAREKIGSHNNISLIQCDAYELEKVGGTFDVVFASDWWSHIPLGALPRFIESVIKKMKPGAEAVFLDMSFREYFRKQPSRFDTDNNRIYHRKLPDGTEFDVVKNFFGEEAIRRILSPYSRDIEYYMFDDLDRWMVMFKR